jgi:hypothetical protein
VETRNLWGDSFKPELIRTPYIIWREQASLLGQLTDNLIEATTERSRMSTIHIEVKLSIIAPALENYTYRVLSVIYKVDQIYPLEVIDHQTLVTETCENEEQFIDTIGKILSSDRVKTVINSLLSQIKSES